MSKYVNAIPGNTDLSTEEVENLSNVMELIEKQEYYHGGWSKISGGYAECEFVDYDDEVVYFNLLSGEKGSGSSVAYVDELTIGRIDLQNADLNTVARTKLVY